MTKHPDKPTITPERIAWFAAYYRKYPSWGVFHVVLSDGNWGLKAEVEYSHDEPGELDAIRWFNTLTKSQQRRLGRKAEDLVP